MWSPDQALRALALTLVTATTLAACTVSPVHAPNQGQGGLDLAIAAPDSRLEQIATRVLSQRLVLAPGENPMQLDISISISASRPGLSRVSRPVTERELLASLTYRVSRDGEIVTSGTRTGRATYVSSPQVLAGDFARTDAEERAVTAAAEAVRLALLAQLGGQ